MKKRSLYLVWLVMLIALLLTLVPLPAWVGWLRPSWVLLVLVFFAWRMPQRVSVTHAFVLGILLDLINGTVLGEHALALVPIIYITVRFHKQLNMFPAFQQMFVILFYSLLYKLIIVLVQGTIGEAPHSFLFWLAAIVNMVLWPWLYILLRDLIYRFYAEHA